LSKGGVLSLSKGGVLSLSKDDVLSLSKDDMGLPKVGSALITPGCEGITDADETRAADMLPTSRAGR
jgi:hypothetical protein